MIRLVRGADNAKERAALERMFRARATLFHDILEWPVTLDGSGRERDDFDNQDMLYLIDLDEKGAHRGSVRLAPTSRSTPLGPIFAELLGENGPLSSPLIWEFTRFCVDPRFSIRNEGAERQRVAETLMLGLCEMGLRQDFRTLLGAAEQPLLKLFRAAGWAPTVVGEAGALFLCVWDVDDAALASMRRLSGRAGSVLEPASRRRAGLRSCAP